MNETPLADTRAIVADGHPVTRWALRAFLTNAGVHVVGEADSIDSALNLAAISRLDVVVTNTVFPDGSARRSIPDLVAGGQYRVVAFTEHDSWENVESFLAAGGTGFVSKRSPLSELLAAIEAATEGRQWVDPTVRSVTRITSAPGVDSLTHRERETVTLIARGLTSRQIADQLCVSLKTVETHRYRIFRKLGVRRVAQLVDYAAKHGLS